MTRTIDYYRKGFKDAIELMELMGKDDGYEEWQAMLEDMKKLVEVPK